MPNIQRQIVELGFVAGSFHPLNMIHEKIESLGEINKVLVSIIISIVA